MDYETQFVKSPAPLSVIDQALEYLDHGCRPFALMGETAAGKERKAPAVKSWAHYQKAPPARQELAAMFPAGRPLWTGLACGGPERRLVIDFDRLSAWDDFADLLKIQRPELLARLCQVKTIKGRHVHLVCPDWQTDRPFVRNVKLANSRDDQGKAFALVETRGEGGYAVVPGGTAPYTHEAGPEVGQGTKVSPEELDFLLMLARSLDEAPDEFHAPAPAGKKKKDDLPGDLFNKACASDPGLILKDFEAAGWAIKVGPKGSHRLTRPGKEEGDSATFAYSRTPNGVPLFHCFTSNAAPFEPGKAYRPFTCLAMLTPFKDGKPDWSAAVEEVIRRGIGKRTTTDTKYPRRKRGSDRRMGSTPWLWWGVLQADALNAFIGGIGANKSALAAFVAAHVSTGRAFPFDPSGPTEPGAVLYFGPESVGDNDAPDEEFLPRVKAAGGDLDQVFTYDEPFTLPEDLDWLEKEIKDTQARLVILDPVNDFISPALQSRDDKHIRVALRPLAKVASKTRCTIVLILHTNKKVGDKAEDRAAGAKAYVSVTRAASYVSKDDRNPNRSVVVPIRTSRLKEQMAMTFERVEAVVEDEGTGEEIETFTLANWQRDDRTADEVAGAGRPDDGPKRAVGAPRKHPDGHEQVYRLFDDGKNVQEIATTVGYDESNVRRVLRRRKREALSGNYSSWNYSSRSASAVRVEFDGRNNSLTNLPGLCLLFRIAKVVGLDLSHLSGAFDPYQDTNLPPEACRPLLSAALEYAGPLNFLYHFAPDPDDLPDELVRWVAQEDAQLGDDPVARYAAWMWLAENWDEPEAALAS